MKINEKLFLLILFWLKSLFKRKPKVTTYHFHKEEPEQKPKQTSYKEINFWKKVNWRRHRKDIANQTKKNQRLMA